LTRWKLSAPPPRMRLWTHARRQARPAEMERKKASGEEKNEGRGAMGRGDRAPVIVTGCGEGVPDRWSAHIDKALDVTGYLVFTDDPVIFQECNEEFVCQGQCSTGNDNARTIKKDL